MNWKTVAGQLAQMGLPLIAKIVGGEIERIPILGSLVDGPELIERIGRKALGLALGVEPEPEAITNAIEGKPTTEVVASLQNVEAGMAAKWPALAEIAKVETEGEVKVAETNAETYRLVYAAEVAANNFWLTLYRTILNYGATFAILAIVFSIVYALWVGGPRLALLVEAKELLAYTLGALGSILGIHFYTRGKEREAAVKPPQQANQPIVATPVVVPTRRK